MNLIQLGNKVAGLSRQLQNLILLGKRFEEFPLRESVNPLSRILVSTDGITEALEMQKVLEAISDESQNNKVREMMLGTIAADYTLENILDNIGLLVDSDELVILSVFEAIDNDADIEQFKQRLFLWKLGKGNFSPIGSDNIDSKLFELPSIFPSEQTADEITQAPNAIVRDYGTDSDSDILTMINSRTPAISFNEDTENISFIYYIRATINEVKYLYQFKGTPGLYGFESGQMTNTDLILIFSSNESGALDGVSVAYVNERMNEALENANDYTNYKLETLTTSFVTEGTKLYFTTARVLDTLLAGFTTIAGPIVSTDSILVAFGKAQNALNSLAFSVGLRELASNKSNAYIVDGTGTKYYTADYINGLQKNYIHKFYKLPVPLTGTAVQTLVYSFPIPAIYAEGRKVRLTAKMYGTGTGNKVIAVSTPGGLSPKNIAHDVSGTWNALPIERNFVFFENKYVNAFSSGSFYFDGVNPIPGVQEFSAIPFQSATNIEVYGRLTSLTDTITAVYVTIEIFDPTL